MIIGIIGNGFVGNATYQLKCDQIQVLAYDINPKLRNPPEIILNDMKKCDIIFISVPTPMSPDGSCYLEIVRSVLDDLKNIHYNGFITIRSTVPVGTCNDLCCYFMPEFLTEKNYIDDFINNKDWIFGLLGDSIKDAKFINIITELFTIAYNNDCIKYNNLHFVTNKEAEMIKLFKNCFLASKISFCNEIYEFCQTKQINYENVRKIACLDTRIGDSHTKVPGHDGLKGFGGTCFPKDMSNLRNEIHNIGLKSYIINAAIERNENVDRVEKDWNNNKGRAVIN